MGSIRELQSILQRKDEEIKKLHNLLQTKDAEIKRLLDAVDSNSTTTPKATTKPNGKGRRARGCGVSAEPLKIGGSDKPLKRHEKSAVEKQKIRSFLKDNDFLNNLDSSQIRELVEVMQGF